MNIISIIIVVSGIESWGNVLFDLDSIPDWIGNGTVNSSDECEV